MFKSLLSLSVFNPRLREGGDMLKLLTYFYIKVFNPRLREGGDVQHWMQGRRILFFNPRLREGGDNGFPYFDTSVLCFQSTPPRRRRL